MIYWNKSVNPSLQGSKIKRKIKNLRRQAIVEKTKKKNGIIAIIVAIVYVIVSMVFDLWAYSWIIWISYAIYRFIVK